MTHETPRTQDNRSGEVSLAWYRYFMPWFVLLLMLTAMSATLVTVVIAVRNPPALVTAKATTVADQPASIRSRDPDE